MNLNLRLTTLDRLVEALALPAATISIGHEACPHKLPQHADIMRAAETVLAHEKRFMFVAPICHERYFQSVVEQMESLASLGNVTLVANDFGLLLTLAEAEWADPCTLAVGHGLSYSFEQLPWMSLTLDEESEQLQEAFYQNSLTTPYLSAQLWEWGVELVEVDSLPRSNRSLANLHTAGFALNMLLDVVPTAYARSCHTARHYRVSPPGCQSCCDKPFHLTMTHRWHLFHDQIEPMSISAQKKAPNFSVYGNVVYQHAPEPIWSDIPAVEQVTLDMRFYTPDELRDRITRLPL